MPSIHINSFVRRQTKESQFSYWTLSDDELLERIEQNFHRAKQGYRDNVLLIPVEPEGFFSGVVELKAGDKLIGEYSARREGEEPRQHVFAMQGEKCPAVAVDVVLYGHNVLAEGNEFETDADYEVVSVNAHTTLDEVPIQPMTLLANHFLADGGTATNMSPEQLEAALRISCEYWKNKALIAPTS